MMAVKRHSHIRISLSLILSISQSKLVSDLCLLPVYSCPPYPPDLQEQDTTQHFFLPRNIYLFIYLLAVPMASRSSQARDQTRAIAVTTLGP